MVPGPSARDVHPRQLFRDTRGLKCASVPERLGLERFGVAACDALRELTAFERRAQHSGLSAVATVFCGRDKMSVCLTGCARLDVLTDTSHVYTDAVNQFSVRHRHGADL